MTNNWRTYECSTKFCSYVTTGTVFQIALRCRGYFPQWRGDGKFCRGKCFYLITNSSLKLKMNICILELSILFPKNLLFLCYIQLTKFWFFEKKSIFLQMFYRFILPWICPWFHDDAILWYTIQFSKNRERYYHRPISYFDLFLSSKLNFFLVKNK